MNFDKQLAEARSRVHALIDAQAIVRTSVLMLEIDEVFHNLSRKWNFPARSKAQLRRREKERAQHLVNQISLG